MKRWRNLDNIYCLWPAKPIGLFEMIGGSYLSSNSQITYRRFLEGLHDCNIAIHTWDYLPSFDHQTQANEAWKSFRKCRKKLELRVGDLPKSIRIGHSLGCKLHLLAPDGGRNSSSLIAISFNNFTASKSIPMLKKIGPKLGFHSEFSPSPNETLNLIYTHYLQPKNLLIQFKEDQLDQSQILFNCLKKRSKDSSESLVLDGDHLTPASAGLRQNLLGNLAENNSKYKNIKTLVNSIYDWISKSIITP